jgi:hypothetical protein
LRFSACSRTICRALACALHQYAPAHVRGMGPPAPRVVHTAPQTVSNTDELDSVSRRHHVHCAYRRTDWRRRPECVPDAANLGIHLLRHRLSRSFAIPILATRSRALRARALAISGFAMTLLNSVSVSHCPGGELYGVHAKDDRRARFGKSGWADFIGCAPVELSPLRNSSPPWDGGDATNLLLIFRVLHYFGTGGHDSKNPLSKDLG